MANEQICQPGGTFCCRLKHVDGSGCIPCYCHLGLILDDNGRKMSKRDRKGQSLCIVKEAIRDRIYKGQTLDEILAGLRSFMLKRGDPPEWVHRIVGHSQQLFGDVG